MRRFRMRQRLLTLRDRFRIRDADGEIAYAVRGRLISLRDRLLFEDADGRDLLEVRQRLVAWRPQYRIFREGRLAAIVSKRLLSVLGSRFVISLRGGGKLLAKGNFFDYEYRFLRGRDQVAQVSKRWFTLADTYGVQIEDEELDELLVLACAVVIDMINHNPERNEPEQPDQDDDD